MTIVEEQTLTGIILQIYLHFIIMSMQFELTKWKNSDGAEAVCGIHDQSGAFTRNHFFCKRFVKLFRCFFSMLNQQLLARQNELEREYRCCSAVPLPLASKVNPRVRYSQQHRASAKWS